MKKLLLALALVLASFGSYAQSGLYPANTVWGNATGATAQPKATAGTSFFTGIKVGSTPIIGGTNTRVLYDNLGILGEYTNAQVTALINLATASLSGALPAWPNNTSTYFRGDGTYATLSCAALTNSSPSCSIDATNASNISTGTLAAARMASFGSGDVSFATAGGAGTIGTNAVTNGKAAQAGANTVKGNFTAGTANVADNAIPSCSDTNGNHLNYVSGTGVTCGNTSAGSGMVLLNTLTASSSATLSDTTSFSGTYTSYLIVLENLVPATNGVLCELQVHAGGTYKSTSYLSTFTATTGSGTEIGNITTYIPCSATISSVSNTLSGLSGSFRVFNPTVTGNAPIQWIGQTGYTAAGGAAYIPLVGAGLWNSATAIDGFQMLFSSGNIASGKIKIFGVL